MGRWHARSWDLLLARTDSEGGGRRTDGLAGTLDLLELYNLGNDPGERFDRLDWHPEIVGRLLGSSKTFLEPFEFQRRPHTTLPSAP